MEGGRGSGNKAGEQGAGRRLAGTSPVSVLLRHVWTMRRGMTARSERGMQRRDVRRPAAPRSTLTATHNALEGAASRSSAEKGRQRTGRRPSTPDTAASLGHGVPTAAGSSSSSSSSAIAIGSVRLPVAAIASGVVQLHPEERNNLLHPEGQSLSLCIFFTAPREQRAGCPRVVKRTESNGLVRERERETV